MPIAKGTASGSSFSTWEHKRVGHSGSYTAGAKAGAFLAAFCLPFLALSYANANDATAPIALQGQADYNAPRQSEAKLIPLRRQAVAGSAITFNRTPQQLPQLGAAQADNENQLLHNMRQQITSRARNALTPDGLAAAMEKGRNAGVQGAIADTGASLAQQAVDTGLRQLESRLSQRFFRTVNLNWSPGFNGREEVYQLDSVMSFYDGERGSLLSQLGVQGRDGEVGTNVGMMLRSRGFEQMTFGLNTFYDYLSDPEVDRWSVGAEALGRWFSFSGNIYVGLSEDVTANGIHYSPDGWDMELAGTLPAFPWVELSGRHYHWDRQGQDDLKGQDYKLTLSPVPLVGMSFRYDDSSGSAGGGSDIGVEFNLSYRIGTPIQEQLQQLKEPHVGTDPWERRFERVRREYEQRVQRRGAAATTTIKADTSCPGGGSSCITTISNVPVPTDAATVVVRVTPPGGVSPSLGAVTNSAGLLRTARNCLVENLPGATCDFDGSGTIIVNLGNVEAGSGGEKYNFSVTFRDSRGDDIMMGNSVVTVSTDTTLPMRTAQGISYSDPVITVNEGGTATYTIRLNSQPTGTPPTVTVDIESSSASIATLSVDGGTTFSRAVTLTFNASNWSMVQTVTVMGVDDVPSADREAMITYTVRGGGYDNFAPDHQQVVVSDNDGASVMMTPVLPSTSLTEGGATASYMLSLNTAPTGTVTIRPASSDTSAVTVSPAELTFTAANTPQTVTVTAVDDPDADSETVSISHVISGGGYDSVTLAAQRVMVTDTGETVGIRSTGGASIAVGEGSTNTYALVLDTQPTATVTIGLTSDNTAAVMVSPASLTFTTVTDPNPASPATTNAWNVPQTVTLTGVEETGANANTANETVMIRYTVSGGDYEGVTLTPQTVTTTDNDIPGLTYNPTSPTVTEGGATSYTIRLNTQPTATVTVAIASSNAAAVTATPASLDFTTTNWSTPQTVMVSSVANMVTANTDFTLSHTITTTDADYSSLNPAPADQTVSVTDVTMRLTHFTVTAGNEQVDISWRHSSEATSVTITASEGGSPVDISTGSLNTATSCPADGAGCVRVVTVTSSPSSTTITGLTNGTSYTFSAYAQDSLGNYTSMSLRPSITRAPVPPNISIVTDRTTLTEGGDAVTITATLNSPPPTGTVTLMVAHAASSVATLCTTGCSTNSPDGDYTLSRTTLTLSSGTTSGDITVTATDDNATEPAEALTLNLTARLGSNAIMVNSMTTHALSLTVADNDMPGLTFNPDPDTLTVMEGDATTYTVVLDTRPTADVMVAIASSDTNTLSLTSGSSLTFTPSDWNTPQRVRLRSGINTITSNTPVTLSYTVTSTGDTDYNGLTVTAQTVTVAEAPDASVHIGNAGTQEANMYEAAAGGATSVTVTVMLSAPAPVDLTLDLMRSGNADIGSGMDYTQSGLTANTDPAYTIDIDEGDSRATFTLMTAGDDSTAEVRETAIFTVQAGTGYDPATGGSETATVTIVSATKPTLTIHLGTNVLTSSVGLSDSGGGFGASTTLNAALSVAAPTGGLVVNITRSGSATQGTNFTLTGSDVGSMDPNYTLTIAGGMTTATGTITTVDDSMSGTNASVTFTLQESADDYSRTRAAVAITIFD